MGRIFGLPRGFRRTSKCRKATQDQSDPASQATETQGHESASPASLSQRDEPYQPASKLMGLPLDLTAVIFDHLEIDDAFAFSLTCKGIHHHLFANARSRLKDANKEDHYKVQTMLEKDLPHDQIYCCFCKTFHTLELDYRKKFCREQDGAEDHSFATFMPRKLTHSLRYLDARAIMNAVLFKRPCASEALMSLRKTFKDGAKDSRWQQTLEPKVIGRQLFFKVDTMHFREKAIEAKDKDEFSYNVCRHVEIHGKFPHMWAHGSQLTRASFFTCRTMFVASCRRCRTDLRLEMVWVGGKGEVSSRAGWNMRIQSWHCLGDVRSPLDRLWMACVSEHRDSDSRWREGDTHHIIDHDNWDHQMEAYDEWHDPDESMIHGFNETLWNKAPEWGVHI